MEKILSRMLGIQYAIDSAVQLESNKADQFPVFFRHGQHWYGVRSTLMAASVLFVVGVAVSLTTPFLRDSTCVEKQFVPGFMLGAPAMKLVAKK